MDLTFVGDQALWPTTSQLVDCTREIDGRSGSYGLRNNSGPIEIVLSVEASTPDAAQQHAHAVLQAWFPAVAVRVSARFCPTPPLFSGPRQ